MGYFRSTNSKAKQTDISNTPLSELALSHQSDDSKNHHLDDNSSNNSLNASRRNSKNKITNVKGIHKLLIPSETNKNDSQQEQDDDA